jgi:hypothetical protein
MKLLSTLIMASLLYASSGFAATLQFRLFTFQGDTPEASDLVRLYENGSIEPTVSSNAVIDINGNFQKRNQETTTFPKSYSDDGKPTEYAIVPVGYNISGTITGKDSVPAVNISFTHSQRIADKFFRDAKNILVAQPIISTTSLDTEMTIPINQWFCFGGIKHDGGLTSVFAVKVEK